MATVQIDDDVSFAQTFLRIQTKQKALIPLRYNGIQKRLLTGLATLNLIVKPRQVGVSTAIQSRYYRLGITGAVSTATLAHDDRTTQALRRMAARFYDTMNIPPGFPKPQRALNNATITTYPDFGSEAMIITAGSQSGGRGMTFTHVHGSEFAFWKDADQLIAGVLQSGNPEIILESTPNGATGKFFELCMEAHTDPERSVWKLFFFRWFDDPTYRVPLQADERLVYSGDELALIEKHQLMPEQIKWRRLKIAEIGSLDDFRQEYPEDLLTCFKRSGIGYFGDIDRCFKAPFGAAYDATHRYVAGLDFGQQQDYTVCVIIDATTMTMVDMVRVNKQEWRDMRLAVRDLCEKWNVWILLAEENSMGGTNIEEMRREFYEKKLKTTIRPFNMSFASKPPLMAGLRAALHEGGLMLQDRDVLKHELNAAVSKSTTKGWTVESPRDQHGHGDSVVATALSNHAVSFVR